MKKIVVLIAIISLISVIYVLADASDSAEMSVSVGNSAPTVDNIIIDSQDTGATVSPNPGTTKSVSLSVEASDANGWDDISTVICTITGSVGDSPVTLSKSYLDTDSVTATGSFDMDFYDASGTYTVYCEATDDGAATGNRQENFTYQTEIALILDSATIAFGSMSPDETDTVTGDTSMATTDAATIQNYGNVQIDAQISASGHLSDGGTETITIDNAEYQFTALGFNDLSTTVQTEADLDLTAGSSSTTNVDFSLYVPPGTANAAYSTTVTITAVNG